MAGLIILGLLMLSGVLLFPVSFPWHNVQELDQAVRHGPSWEPVVPLAQFWQPPAGSSIVAPPRGVRAAHSTTSWLGHDDLGRSLLYRLLLAWLVSIIVGLGAAVLSVGMGTVWGAVAGMAGGRVDFAMMRIVDTLYGLPYLLMVILMQVALARPLTSLWGQNRQAADFLLVVLAIGSVSWLTMARVIRGQVLSLKTRPFMDAARAMGAGRPRILCRHVLPHLGGPIVVYATLVIPQAILQESFLSFLGIGVRPPLPSLGRLAADGLAAVNAYVDYWWLLVFPCGALLLTLLSLNFIGDGLRDAWDPKSAEAIIT
jgi:ABC-type dipeptide/oligopeptide/nickel transport system permease subunit